MTDRRERERQQSKQTIVDILVWSFIIFLIIESLGGHLGFIYYHFFVKKNRRMVVFDLSRFNIIVILIIINEYLYIGIKHLIFYSRFKDRYIKAERDTHTQKRA